MFINKTKCEICIHKALCIYKPTYEAFTSKNDDDDGEHLTVEASCNHYILAPIASFRPRSRTSGQYPWGENKDSDTIYPQ